MKHDWTIDGWRNLPARHQPEYPDPRRLAETLEALSHRPPLVFPGEVERLRAEIASASRGEAFLLQGGDCVERFIDCTPEDITNRLKVLLQMSVILTHAARRPVVRIGRMAGQFFKPRSTEYEESPDGPVMTYRGDPVHAFELTSAARRPDPSRLETGYFHAAATLNYIRAMIAGGFADLHHPFSWNLHGIEHTEQWKKYREVLESVLDAVQFMESFGGLNRESLGSVEFFTSHEALHLDYESALTRFDPDTQGWYNLAAHMVWVGERTRSVNEAHIEYARGLENPVGVKVGPTTSADDVEALAARLNPDHLPGKLVLITRFGADRVAEALPPLIERVGKLGVPVAWCCDPMHGNTRQTDERVKTRDFDDVLRELDQSFEVHKRCDSTLAGVHFEITGDPVTECTGGAVGLTEADLNRDYRTYCDPRLNYVQGIEMAFLIAEHLRADPNRPFSDAYTVRRREA